MRISPDQGLQFAQMLVQDEEPLADITQVRRLKRTVALEEEAMTLLFMVAETRHEDFIMKSLIVSYIPYTFTFQCLMKDTWEIWCLLQSLSRSGAAAVSAQRPIYVVLHMYLMIASSQTAATICTSHTRFIKATLERISPGRRSTTLV